MGLDVVGISLSPQSKSSVDQNDKNSAKESTKNKNQSKYVTETVGNYEYTYVVIGELRLLVGRVPKEEDKDKDEKKTGDATDKKNVHTITNNVQTLIGYQQSVTAALPKNNPQEKIQATEKYADNSYYDIAKVNAKG